jgi:GntR family transcriptional regulator/MocR family aminotransferase
VNRSKDSTSGRSKAPGAAPASPGTREPRGSDFLQLDIGEAPSGARAEWLAERLREAVADGRLPLGSRLPATRVLAEELRVSRGLVTEAYQQLAECGYIAGRGRNGTVVVCAPVDAPPAAPRRQPRPAPTGALFPGEPGMDVFDALRVAPARINLIPGLPDLTAFPRTGWLRAERAVLGELSAAALGYGDPRGTTELRQAVVTWLARNRGIRAEPDQVLILAGTAQAATLLARILPRHGIDRLAVEDPGSLGMRQHIQGQGMATPPVPVDAEGLRVDALRASGARAVLVTPAHQFPMGVVLGGAGRRELSHWAVESDGLIIEDDYDSEHRHDRPPVRALRAMLPDHVCYAGSVSKLLAPALRVGWLLAPAKYHDDLVDAKRMTDLGNAALPQLVLARLMESGGMDRHLRQLRRRHRQRRDAMTEAIAAHLPGATVHGAAAGLHLTITFGPDPGSTRNGARNGARNAARSGDFSDTELCAAALAEGVKVQPLSWHSQLAHRPGLVLGYAAMPPSAIREGVAVIGAALRRLR